ncbi:CAP domain-containing protein [Massilia sp. 9096]|uniref:CAP domain-containing protein n=1 Tax=Massilia sp. 9096 TaxID=1500894 RepID=UPI0009DE59BB|nr:CAP domain-containing protein [Massilia sp. 9096]
MSVFASPFPSGARLPLRAALACAGALALGAPAHARADELANLINAYRAVPSSCAGQAADAAAPLAPEPALAGIRIGPGTFLESALKRAGYSTDHAEAIFVTGPPDAPSAMQILREKYCGRLLSSEFSAVGTARHGNEWQVVLAHRFDIPVLPGQQQTGEEILALVNAARAQPRTCGTQAFSAAGPLRWNDTLAEAALGHSTELATHHYFSHVEHDGSTPASRVTRTGYGWSRVGENIASGQRTAAEAVQSWLDSPGHCANIMNPTFTETGTAYAINPGNENHTAYWTQVFARPR